MVIAPKSTAGFSRVEKDLSKIRALWKEGYDEGMHGGRSSPPSSNRKSKTKVWQNKKTTVLP